MKVIDSLQALRDPAYAQFQAKLIPGISPERVIGVRVPALRKLAKELVRSGAAGSFLAALPHTFFDENMLHALVISEIRDYELCIAELDRFLPFVDNWAVCDSLCPKAFGRNRDRLPEKIRDWAASEYPFTCRFGLKTLMAHFLDADFRPEYLEIPAAARSGEYYVRMMVAWFFATALAKQWNAAVPYLEECRLEPWTHNKTIQKARESYRITPEQKEYLSRLRRKDG